jgi:hypothetical protein
VCDLVVERFMEDKAQPNAISLAFGMSGQQITRILVDHHPREYVRRQMIGGMSAEDVSARTGLPLSFVMEGHAVAAKINAAKFHAAPHPRMILRTTDGRTTISTDPGMIIVARHQMTAMAKGRAWTEDRVG